MSLKDNTDDMRFRRMLRKGDREAEKLEKMSVEEREKFWDKRNAKVEKQMRRR